MLHKILDSDHADDVILCALMILLVISGLKTNKDISTQLEWLFYNCIIKKGLYLTYKHMSRKSITSNC